MTDFQRLPELTANKARVFNLLDDMRKAWEKILNDYHETVPFVDGFMAVHNFHKLALDHIATETNMTGEAAAQFFLMAGATFQKAMETRAEQCRAQ